MTVIELGEAKMSARGSDDERHTISSLGADLRELRAKVDKLSDRFTLFVGVVTGGGLVLGFMPDDIKHRLISTLLHLP